MAARIPRCGTFSLRNLAFFATTPILNVAGEAFVEVTGISLSEPAGQPRGGVSKKGATAILIKRHIQGRQEVYKILHTRVSLLPISNCSHTYRGMFISSYNQQRYV